jgi:predicted nucleotidyltransferase
VPDVAAQLEALVAGLREILGDALAGIYLHGSLRLGGFGPRSDVDVLAVVSRPTTAAERSTLAQLLARVSGDPRPAELDVLVHSDVRPWRHPARFDFHYSDSSGVEVDGENRDLAAVIAVARTGAGALFGPPPAEVFEPVPRADYVDAILEDFRELDRIIGIHTRSVVLALARMWADLTTGDIHSKAEAVAWALVRLPPDHRAVLRRAWTIHAGDADEAWDDAMPAVEAYAAHLRPEIEQASSTPPRPTWRARHTGADR